MLTAEAAMAILRETGVVRTGHFLLTTGLHSPEFWLCSQVMQYPRQAEVLCAAMAEPFRNAGVQTVVGPAMGGILLAYEVARALGVRALFTEKAADGGMALKRGFTLSPGERVLVVEDAVTTGSSIRQALAALAPLGVEIAGVSVLVDRSGGEVQFGVPTHALVTTRVPAWRPEECPLCRQGEPLTRPKG